MLLRRFVPVLLASALLVSIAAAPAGAKPIYQYFVESDSVSFYGSGQSNLTVERINPALSSTTRITRDGIELVRAPWSAGTETVWGDFPELQPGDVIEIYQPSIAAGPPMVAPVESFTLPAASLTSDSGATVLTGTAPSDAVASAVTFTPGCFVNSVKQITLSPVANSFSAPLESAVRPGTRIRLHVFPGGGDEVVYGTRTSGESPCLAVDATTPFLPPGQSPSATPYSIDVRNLNPTITDIRVVASRGGSAYLDQTLSAFYTSVDLDLAERPLPGDSIAVYRPAAAASPTFSYQLPSITAGFDPDNDLVAVDAVALSGMMVRAKNTFINDGPIRSIGPTAAGRTLFSFAEPEAGELFAGFGEHSSISVRAIDSDDRIRFELSATRADLLAPTVSPSLRKAFSAKKIARTLKLSVKASEATSAKITVSLPRNLPGASNPRRKASGRLQVIAKRSVSLAQGSSTVKLSLNSRGRKAVKRLRAAGRRLRAVPLTVTIVSKDAAGNSSALVQVGKVSR